MRLASTRYAVFFSALLVSCSATDVEGVDRELRMHALQTQLSADKIEDALSKPGTTSTEWAAGVDEIESTVRALARLEVDEFATEAQQVLAVLYQARAWDDVARITKAAAARENDVSRDILHEKSFPSRIAAQNAYERAFRIACRLSQSKGPAWLEIIDGVERYSDGTLRDNCLQTK